MAEHEHISCHEVVELVTDYLEGALPEHRAREVHDHLEECVDCLRYLGQIQLTAELLAHLDDDGPDTRLVEDAG